MTTAVETKPANTDTTNDDRVRHFVERLSPPFERPPRYSKIALCGEEVRDVLRYNGSHNGSVCQACVDAARNIKPEKLSS